MKINAYTLNITYNEATRPITFVENGELDLFKISSCSVTALVLYTFRDLIPDYQDYALMIMPFNIRRDTEGTFTLPVKEFIVNVETLGHGSLELKIPNGSFDTEYRVHELKMEIEKELGIPRDCIDLCNEAGDNIVGYSCDYSLVYAVFTDYKQQIIDKGYEILEFKSVIKEGRTMVWREAREIVDGRSKRIDKIGNYRMITFEPCYGVVTKRTPKMVKLRYGDLPRKTKINSNNLIGEYFDGDVVMYDDKIEYGKTYAIAVTY